MSVIEKEITNDELYQVIDQVKQANDIDLFKILLDLYCRGMRYGMHSVYEDMRESKKEHDNADL